MHQPHPGSESPITPWPTRSDEVISPESPPDPKDGFRLLVDGATEYAVFALSPEGIVCTWNLGAERLKGYRREEIIGRNFSMFFPEVDRDAGVPQRILEAAIVEGRAATEGWRIRKDGSRFWASGIVTPLYDAAGRVRGFGKLIRDDTGRRDQQERQIRHTEQERIAVSLADTVVRRVFAISLHANSAMHLTSDAAARERLELLVQEADETIRFLRSAIFEIGGAPGGPP